jgi:hypothetical protein
LMHDTEGVVYIANGSGKAWIEMTIKKESFVTHEPFTRPAGGRDKDDIA